MLARGARWPMSMAVFLLTSIHSNVIGVVWRVGPQLSTAPVADSGRLGLDTGLTNIRRAIQSRRGRMRGVELNGKIQFVTRSVTATVKSVGMSHARTSTPLLARDNWQERIFYTDDHA